MMPLELLLYFLFPAYAVLVLTWHGLLLYMFRYLAEDHPGKYDAIGRPTILFWSSSLRTIGNVWFFITGKEYLSLADAKLTRICIALRVIFVLSIVCFMAIIISFYFIG